MPTKKLRASQEEIIDGIFESDQQYVIAGMGAGKTAATLHALSELWVEDVIHCAIVLAPPLVASTVWPKEPAKWGGPKGLGHIEVLAPATADRRAIDLRRVMRLKGAGGLRIVSLSFHLCQWLADNADLIPAKCALVIDEGSFFKSPRSKNGKALREIADRFVARYILSGTPRPNGYGDLWGQYTILKPGIWKPFDEWQRDNFRPDDYNGYNWTVHDFRARQIDAKVAPLTTRIEVDLGLEPLNAGPDFDTWVDLPPAARAAYDEMEDHLITKVAKDLKSDDEDVVVAALMQAVASSKLAQIAQGYLYDKPEGAEKGEKVADLHEAKADALRDLLYSCEGENVLIWYGYRADIDLIQKVLGNCKLPILGGGTSPAQGKRWIEDFGKGLIPRLLAHPASAAHGIDDLKHNSNRMIWFCPTWSAEQYEQALKRLHRPGQAKPVFSHQIAARGTVDEVKLNRVAYKLDDQAYWAQLVARTRKEMGT
jgi:hypothetical protein